MFQLEESPNAVGVDVVRDRRSTELNRVQKDFPQSQPQSFQLCPGQPTRRSARSDTGTKEAFVGVDISHA